MLILKRFIFIGIIFLVILSAHLSDSNLYVTLHTIGLDVPLTPFTADMTLMLDKSKNSDEKAYYMKKYVLEYQSPQKLDQIQLEKLGWYEFKAPFQWVSECQEGHSQCPDVIYYICKSLSAFTKEEVLSWQVVEVGKNKQNTEAGIGVNFICQ